jgi:glycosyltransferase involved in cell wall biosynthesis
MSVWMRGTIVYLLAEDFLFMSHFVERAVAAKAAGMRVVVAARHGPAAERIRTAGLEFVPLDFRRRSLNPFRELGTISEIARLYQAEKPDLVHHIALKPIIYGTIAAWLKGVKAVVNAPIGMGFIFTSRKPLARLLRPVVRFALRMLLNPKGSRVVFENPEDRDDLVAGGYVRSRDAVLIPGAGVDLEEFHPNPEPPSPVVVVLAARMLESKGVREFVAAARILRERGITARFKLAGAPDPGNPESIPEHPLREWSDSGIVEWLGHRTDMAAVYGAAHIACLPSYREGLPKALLEAMAAGLPVVSTDVVGCRYAVAANETGLLVPARDAEALAEALATVIGDAALRRRFGAAGRQRAERLFGSPAIIAQTLQLYDELTEP